MQRRHITTAVTLLLLCGILVLGLVVGYKSLFSPLPGDDNGTSATPSRSCTSPSGNGNRVRTSQVQVSVFNGGTRSGLASVTLRHLARRGFQSGDVGNAPSSAKVARVQVWTTVKHDVAAKLVALQFGDATRIRVRKTDLGPGVDVVVGDDYHGLVDAPRVLRVGKSQRLCVSKASPSTNG